MIEKCRRATPLLYSGQSRDMYREERAKVFINSSFVATSIQPFFCIADVVPFLILIQFVFLIRLIILIAI